MTRGIPEPGAAPSRLDRVWRQRAASLSRRPTEAALDLNALVALVVSIGGELYGIALRDIAEVLPPIRVTPVPGAPAGVAGVVNVLGEIRPVVDMRSMLGLTTVPGGAPGLVVVVRHGDATLGLQVDTVEQIRSVRADALQGSAGDPQDLPWRYLTGLTRDMLRLLRTEALFSELLEGVTT